MKNRNESGQATVEFALVTTLLMAVVLFLVQLALLFGWGNYVQYATYLSARAYVSSGPSKEDQLDRARTVIVRMLKKGGADRAPFIAKGVGGNGVAGTGITIGEGTPFNNEDFALSWREGVRYTFKGKVFLLPLGRGPSSSSDEDDRLLTLTSETWLGREPSEQECQGVMNSTKGLIDNGC